MGNIYNYLINDDVHQCLSLCDYTTVVEVVGI